MPLADVSHQSDRLEFSRQGRSSDVFKRDRKLVPLPFHIDGVEHVPRAIEREPGHVVFHNLRDTRHHLIHPLCPKNPCASNGGSGASRTRKPRRYVPIRTGWAFQMPNATVAVGTGLEPAHASLA